MKREMAKIMLNFPASNEYRKQQIWGTLNSEDSELFQLANYLFAHAWSSSKLDAYITDNNVKATRFVEQNISVAPLPYRYQEWYRSTYSIFDIAVMYEYYTLTDYIISKLSLANVPLDIVTIRHTIMLKDDAILYERLCELGLVTIPRALVTAAESYAVNIFRYLVDTGTFTRNETSEMFHRHLFGVLPAYLDMSYYLLSKDAVNMDFCDQFNRNALTWALGILEDGFNSTELLDMIDVLLARNIKITPLTIALLFMLGTTPYFISYSDKILPRAGPDALNAEALVAMIELYLNQERTCDLECVIKLWLLMPPEERLKAEDNVYVAKWLKDNKEVLLLAERGVIVKQGFRDA